MIFLGVLCKLLAQSVINLHRREDEVYVKLDVLMCNFLRNWLKFLDWVNVDVGLGYDRVKVRPDGLLLTISADRSRRAALRTFKIPRDWNNSGQRKSLETSLCWPIWADKQVYPLLLKSGRYCATSQAPLATIHLSSVSITTENVTISSF